MDQRIARGAKWLLGAMGYGSRNVRMPETHLRMTDFPARHVVDKNHDHKVLRIRIMTGPGLLTRCSYIT